MIQQYTVVQFNSRLTYSQSLHLEQLFYMLKNLNVLEYAVLVTSVRKES